MRQRNKAMSDPGVRAMSLALRLCALQFAGGAVAALVCYLAVGVASACAAMIGASAAAVPAIFFAWRTLLPGPGSSPQTILRALYRGEAGKLLLTVIVFGLGLKFYSQHLPALLFTYMACLAVYWGGTVYLLSVKDGSRYG